VSRVSGPRPWSIRLFVILFAMQALAAFATTLGNLDGELAYYAGRYPSFGFTRDTIIVIASARLTIAAIPMALVWFYASRLARWMATALAALKLLRVPSALTMWAASGEISLVWAAGLLLGTAAVTCLFTPAARRFFAKHHRARAEAFD